jgi:hypothetical protein
MERVVVLLLALTLCRVARKRRVASTPQRRRAVAAARKTLGPQRAVAVLRKLRVALLRQLRRPAARLQLEAHLVKREERLTSEA